jgi:hypothetical protein
VSRRASIPSQANGPDTRAFTEQGVAMLSSVLNHERAAAKIIDDRRIESLKIVKLE